MAGISLIVLLAVILVAYFKKINPGLMGMVASFIFGFFMLNSKGVVEASVKGGMSTIIGAFPAKLWFRLMMVAIFFAISQQNGALETLTKRLLAMLNGRARLVPWLIYIITYALAALGCGSIGVTILMMPIAAALLKSANMPFLCGGLAVAMGGWSGGLSPLAATGIIVNETAAVVGITVGTYVFIRATIISLINMTLEYFIFGGYKVKKIDVQIDAGKLGKDQVLSLVAILAFAVAACLGYEISFLAATGIVLLELFTKVDEKAIIQAVPWPTLTLLCGMNMMIKVVDLAGGIKLLSDFFQQFMHGALSGVFMCIIAGIMSFVSSASGVVIPTLNATVPALSAAAGADPLLMVCAVACGSHATAISPFSTGGSVILAMSGDSYDPTKLFNILVIAAFVQLALECVYCIVGLM